MIRKLVFLLAIVAIVSGATIVSQAQPQSPLTRHTRDVVLNGQAPLVGHLPATQSMRLVLVLPHRDLAGLESLLHELYDPSSPSYRKFLTVEQFTEKFGPSPDDYNSVIRFAQAHGLRVVATSSNRMNLDLRGSVASIEKAFHVQMGLYQHPTEGRTFFAPDREPTPDMPVQLWHITGLDNYSIPKPALLRRDPSVPLVKSNATTGSCPSASFCGSDMRAAYYEGTALTGSGQSLGLLEYAGTDLADLTTYFKNAGQTNNVPVTLLSTDGTPTSCTAKQDCDDTEQTIDMTQAIGMAPGMSSLVMYVGSSDSAIFNAMATAKPLNAQLSSSWVWAPADPNTDNPYFEEFAAQGQNLFQAAGDSGKYSGGSETWPADDQYLTAVGGTDLDTTGPGGAWASETAWSDGGGGISPNKVPIPSWQVATAEGCAQCSKIYRNDPDVAANSNFTFYVCADQTTCSANLYGGTSFAAPMWAGYLALANQQAVANGQPTLGFINPAIYDIGLSSSYDLDFHDITSGSNGFSATVGYDLATGWGSPNGDNLINALVPAPVGSFTLAATPKKASIAPGGHGSAKITATPSGGFDSAITLTASGEPTSVKVAFKPGSIAGGSGSAAMQMNVAATAKAGTYTITITGTGGTVTETTTFTLTIT